MPSKGYRHSTEAKQKIANAKIGNNWNIGKKHSEESKRKMSETKKGHIVSIKTRRKLSEFNKGKKLSIETREKMKLRNGDKCYNWKGNDVGYFSLHNWIVRLKGRAFGCSSCDTIKDRMYNWANITGMYKRDVRDFVSLFVPCHRVYDRNMQYLKNLHGIKTVELLLTK